MFSAITVAPKPSPSAPVARQSTANAAPEPISSGLAASSAIASDVRRQPEQQHAAQARCARASLGASAEASDRQHDLRHEHRGHIATLERAKPDGLVRMALAAGKGDQRQALRHARRIDQRDGQIAGGLRQALSPGA